MSHGALPSVIVKLGGSLLREGPPRLLLHRLSGMPHMALVPGGGELADTVRAIQPRLGLSEGAAHKMAILAMEQMAHALADLAPALALCATREDFARPRAGAALWLPARMLIGAEGIAESWEVTSDSLALWLATTLGAARLVLVKAPGAPVPAGPLSGQDDLSPLAAAGLVDGAFQGMAHGFPGSIVVVTADDSARLEEAVHPGARQGGPGEDRPREDHP